MVEPSQAHRERQASQQVFEVQSEDSGSYLALHRSTHCCLVWRLQDMHARLLYGTAGV